MLATEAREGPNTQEKPERFMATTGHHLEDVMATLSFIWYSGEVAIVIVSLPVPRWKRVTSARKKGGDPRTGQTRKGTTRTPGWHPEETASQLPILSKRQGEDSRNLALRRHWLPQVVAATAGVRRRWTTTSRLPRPPARIIFHIPGW